MYTAACLFVSICASPLFAGGGQENVGEASGSSAASGSRSSIAGSGENTDIDHVGIAALMVRDGNYDRAEKALSNVDPEDEGIDKARYFTIKGLIELRKSQFDKAITSFNRAIDHGQNDPVIHVYLAQAYFGAAYYVKAIESIDKVQNLNQFPELISMKAQAHWQVGETGEAFGVVERAIGIYPSRKEFLRQKILFLIELNLNREAAEQSLVYLQKAGEDPDAYITIGEALRRGGEHEQAIQTLEMGNIRFPDEQKMQLALAHTYAQSGHPLIAAKLVEETAAYEPKYYYEAAELYRRAGQLSRALYNNSLLTNQETKTEQRFNLLLALERYEEALALEARMKRLGLLEKDSIRYAMAYVHFKAQHFDQANAYINAISSAEYFREATQLRKAIELMRKREYRYF